MFTFCILKFGVNPIKTKAVWTSCKLLLMMKISNFLNPFVSATLLGIAFSISTNINAQTVVDVELSLIIDGSVSIDESDFENQLKAYFEIFNDDKLFNDTISKGENGSIAVNLIQFGGSTREEIEFMHINSVETSREFASKIQIGNQIQIDKISGGTSFTNAIREGRETLQSNSFDGINIIDLSTDGRQSEIDSSTQLNQEREEAENAGIIVNAIGLGSDTFKDSLKEVIVVNGEAFVAEDITEFRSVLEEKIVAEISGNNGNIDVIDPDPTTTPEPNSVLAIFSLGLASLIAKPRLVRQ